MSSVAGMLLGLLVGLRHAFEPDHLSAMATFAAEARDARRGAAVGAIWGLGHTISLVAVGIVLIAIGGVLPARLAAAFELAVAAVLVLLGVRAIARAWRAGSAASRGVVHDHAHGHRRHRHDGPEAHIHVGRYPFAWRLAARSLAVGLVHGLAGSGALTALVFVQLPSAPARLAYIALFGIGSIAGMSAASAVAAASLHALPGRAYRALSLGAGALSVGLGVVWSMPLFSQLG